MNSLLRVSILSLRASHAARGLVCREQMLPCDRTSFVGIFLGIDGGGTKTACLVGDEKSVLGEGASSGSNVLRVGERKARQAITTAVQQACAAARVLPGSVDRACVGIAGGARPETATIVRQIVAELVSGQIEVVGDMVIAMEAAAGTGPGVVVIAGTGSIAYGRNSAGQTARAGGWGFAISDEGSGSWIGRKAVSAAMRAFDEGRGTALLEAAIKSWNLNSREELIVTANAQANPDFAGLLGTVVAAAEADDPAAHDVLAEAGAELATLAKIVIRRIFQERENIPVAMSGGVFGNSALVRQVFYNNLRLDFPNAAVNANVVDPVQGALQLARRGTEARAAEF